MPGVADEQEGSDPAHFPTEEEQQPVAGQQQRLQPGKEETEDDEVAMEARLAMQVGGRETHHQPADQRTQRRHRQRQGVEQEGNLAAPVGGGKPRGEHPLAGPAVPVHSKVDQQQQKQAAERRQFAQARRRHFAGIASAAPEQHAQTNRHGGEQRQQGHQPDAVGDIAQEFDHVTPPSSTAGASGPDSPANQSCERATCGSTRLPAQGSQPRRGQ
ncbi:hypothetical protein SDC9_185873 [bioreactor metagenome]|uniref:Uncharacterized protein n=1 Tax=bioreactor metagenome TaxID=1076179 RepID=A0A645HJG9_9ZZZZ